MIFSLVAHADFFGPQVRKYACLEAGGLEPGCIQLGFERLEAGSRLRGLSQLVPAVPWTFTMLV